MNAAWRRARRILCVRLDSVGDVLMTTPALRALKESGEGRRLTLLTSRTGAALAAHLPMVDDVWTYDAPWVKHPDVRGDPVADLDMIDRLLAGRFDAAAVFTVYSQNPLPAAMMCWLAGIPLRLAHCRENPYELLTDRVPESEPESHVRHEVARQLALVRAIGATTSNWRMAFEPGDAARRAVSERLQATLQRIGGPRRPGAPSGRWLVVHPGASAASRRWPAERFGEVAASVAPLFDGIAVTGSERARAGRHGVRARARGAVGGRAVARRTRRADRDGRPVAVEQFRPGASRGRARHAGGRSLCADQSAAHAWRVPHRC